MNLFLKQYEIVLKAEGPVFVGDGKQIQKNEYILDRLERRVIIPKTYQMFADLEKQRLGKEFEKFLMSGRGDLGIWLTDHGISKEEMDSWADYILDNRDVGAEYLKRMSIQTFIKEPGGRPYIPGSSVKGALRSILLGLDMQKNPGKYQSLRRQVRQEASFKTKRKKYLSDPAAEIEAICFRTMKRNLKKPKDAVNDVFSGLRVGDSAPLSTKQLILTQKTDLKKTGNTRKINVLRECLKPGTEICLPLTIDENCGITKEEILDAVKQFNQMYYEVFLRHFPNVEKPKMNTMWIGGGAGFLTKTVTYPLLGYQEGLKTTAKIMERLTPVKHGHSSDVKNGISPHTCKMALHKKKLFQMGRVDLQIR